MMFDESKAGNPIERISRSHGEEDAGDVRRIVLGSPGERKGDAYEESKEIKNSALGRGRRTNPSASTALGHLSPSRGPAWGRCLASQPRVKRQPQQRSCAACHS